MSEYYCLKNGAARAAEPDIVFPFLNEKHHIVSIIGAGGKTTLMYTLAGIAAGKNNETSILTTTHIAAPKRFGILYISGREDSSVRYELGEKVNVYGRIAAHGKLRALPESKMCEIIKRSELTLIEADGAKRRCCKVPAEHEPVILRQSDLVIGVVGLDAVHRPIEECCFRPEQTEKLLGKNRTEYLSEEDLVTILLSEEGAKKGVGGRTYYTVLNKADTPERRACGERILRMLAERGQELAVMTCLRKRTKTSERTKASEKK